MDLLARREHARLELERKLARKFGHSEIVIEEISRLQAEGLQSDSRLADAFVRSRVARGQGPVKIRSELRGKGVPDNVVEAALSSSGVDWFELAAQVAAKRFGEEAPADAKEKAKRSRFLQQRGFDYDQIGSIY